jgi:hypothetical protein
MQDSHNMFYYTKGNVAASMASTGTIAAMGGIGNLSPGTFVFQACDGSRSGSPGHNEDCIGGMVNSDVHMKHVGVVVEVAVEGLSETFLAVAQAMPSGNGTLSFWSLAPYDNANGTFSVTGDSGNWTHWGIYP